MEDDPDGDDFGRAPRRSRQDTPNAVLLPVCGALLGLGFGLTGRCPQGPVEVCQLSISYPSEAKKAALKRPTGCTRDST